MSWNIEVEGGTSVRLPTAGKYCDRDIVVTATGGVEVEKTAYAVFSADDNSLTFYKTSEEIVSGSQYGEKTATSVYSGFEDADAYSSGDEVPWAEHKSAIVSVSFVDTVQPKSTAYWFYYFTICTVFDLTNLDTSRVVSMVSMFDHCQKVTELNLDHMNTSNVEDMTKMFYTCSVIPKLDLYVFDTTNVRSFNSMFRSCNALADLDTSSLKTKNCTDMGSMFKNCIAMKNINVLRFDTSNVTDMNAMFYNCAAVTEYDLRSFDTAKVTDMAQMFWRNSKVEKIHMGSFSSESLATANEMFSQVGALKEITVGENWAWKYSNGYLPTPSSGYWYDQETGEAYLPSELPNNVNVTFGVTAPTGGGVSNIGGITQYVKTTATTTSKNSMTIINPLGGLAKKVSLYCPADSETATKLGVVQMYSIDTTNGYGVMKLLNASTGNVTLYGSTQKENISANSQFAVTEGKITLRSYNSTTCIWDSTCEYEVEIWQ